MMPVVWNHCSSHCCPWFSNLLLKCIWRTPHPDCRVLQPPTLSDEREQGHWLPAEEVSWESDDQSTYQQPQQSSSGLFSVVAWGSAEASWGQEAKHSCMKQEAGKKMGLASWAQQRSLLRAAYLWMSFCLPNNPSFGIFNGLKGSVSYELFTVSSRTPEMCESNKERGLPSSEESSWGTDWSGKTPKS